jgi:hypothetical protein
MPFEIPTTVDIKDGTYPATLEKVEASEGQYGTMRKWHWLVENGDKIDSLSVITSANTGPQSKSYLWLTALLGRAPQAGEKLEDPTGTRVLLQIGHNDKGFPTVLAVHPYQEPQQTVPGIPR